MEIKIIGDINYLPAMLAWSNSRSRDNKPDPAVFSVDAPVNEMPSVLLEFKDFMIIEREIFTSARNHVIWARTSRVDNGLNFTTPDEFHVPKVHGHLRANMHNNAKDGMPQDQWRMDLPLVSETSWTARMSYRDLIKMHKYFLYLAASVTHGLNKRFAKLAKELYYIVRKFFPDAATCNKAIDSMKEVHYLYEGKHFFNEISLSHDFQIISLEISIALRAQLVRHREILLTDNFFDKVLCNTEFASLTLRESVLLQTVASNAMWATIVGKRACWIAQADLWQPITQHFAAGMLPCNDGLCPYAMDAEARLKGNDPGVPCPRYCNLTNQNAAKSLHKKAMIASLKDRKVNLEVAQYWTKEINA